MNERDDRGVATVYACLGVVVLLVAWMLLRPAAPVPAANIAAATAPAAAPNRALRNTPEVQELETLRRTVRQSGDAILRLVAGCQHPEQLGDEAERRAWFLFEATQ